MMKENEERTVKEGQERRRREEVIIILFKHIIVFLLSSLKEGKELEGGSVYHCANYQPDNSEPSSF